MSINQRGHLLTKLYIRNLRPDCSRSQRAPQTAAPLQRQTAQNDPPLHKWLRKDPDDQRCGHVCIDDVSQSVRRGQCSVHPGRLYAEWGRPPAHRARPTARRSRISSCSPRPSVPSRSGSAVAHPSRPPSSRPGSSGARDVPHRLTVVMAIAADGRPVGWRSGRSPRSRSARHWWHTYRRAPRRSFPRIRTATSFCVNVLGAHQEDLPRVRQQRRRQVRRCGVVTDALGRSTAARCGGMDRLHPLQSHRGGRPPPQGAHGVAALGRRHHPSRWSTACCRRRAATARCGRPGGERPVRQVGTAAATTATRAWASMAIRVQRRQEVQRRTRRSSSPVRVLVAWKDSSMRQRVPATRTSLVSATGRASSSGT